jgi:AP-3 complex subunit beta
MDPDWIFTAGWQVVKNVAAQSLEVKKLVYLYLLHYAEK